MLVLFFRYKLKPFGVGLKKIELNAMWKLPCILDQKETLFGEEKSKPTISLKTYVILRLS